MLLAPSLLLEHGGKNRTDSISIKTYEFFPGSGSQPRHLATYLFPPFPSGYECSIRSIFAKASDQSSHGATFPSTALHAVSERPQLIDFVVTLYGPLGDRSLHFITSVDMLMRTPPVQDAGPETIPWELWIPRFTRCFEHTGSRFLQGWQLLLPTQNVVLNFNSREVARIHARGGNDGNGAANGAEVVQEPTEVDWAPNIRITTHLPYLKTNVHYQEWVGTSFWDRDTTHFGERVVTEVRISVENEFTSYLRDAQIDDALYSAKFTLPV